MLCIYSLKKREKGKWSKNIIATIVSQLANSEAAAFCLFSRLLSANATTENTKPRGSALLRRKQQKFTYPSFVIQNGSPLSQLSSCLVSRVETTTTFMIQCGCHSHHSDPTCQLVAPYKLPQRGQTKNIYIHIGKKKKSARSGLGGREKEAVGGWGRASRLWASLCNSPETHQQ